MRRLRSKISVHDSASRFRDIGEDVFLGHGRFTGDHAVEVGGTPLRYGKAVIATGARAVTLEVLADAFERLKDHDLVVGPATDGGYYLIGLHRPIGELFPEAMPWGQADVRERTLSIGRRLGLSVALVRELSDVDRPEDLAGFAGSELLAGLATDITVIIPALNEARMIAAAIESVRQAPHVEAIVVDGGSMDGTMAVSENAGARVLRSARGRARQMNAGASAATASTLLFLHADTSLPEGFDAHVRAALAAPDVAAGAFEFRLDRAGPGLRLIERLVNLRTRRCRLPYGDQAIFLRAETFSEVGGFPDWPIMEGIEIIRRLRKRGRIHIVPAPVVTSARRWSRHGVVRTTLINLAAAGAYLLGVSPERLARWRG